MNLYDFAVSEINRVLCSKSQECLLWLNHCDSDGYGRVKRPKENQMFVHMLALKIKLQRDITLGYHSAHLCKNKNCYNPWHLEEKTSIQNEHDKRRDKTSPRHQGLLSTNTSGFKGVVWRPKLNKWVARINFGNIQKHIGCYDDKIKAAQAYDDAAKAAWGLDCYLNFPNESLDTRK